MGRGCVRPRHSRDQFELSEGLGRTIADQKQAFGAFASDVAFNNWLGWSGGPLNEHNEAAECLSVGE